VHESANLHFLGFHCHIGSQIFETNGFVMAVERIYEFLETVRTQLQVEIKVLNLGGGYGIRYKEGDTPLPGQDYIKVITDAVRSECEKRHFALPEIWIEPGRSIVGDAGTTLYRVGASKSIPGIRKYLAVDGGMTDNPRPALYQAVYEAALANRMNEANEETVSIAGKCCESGDMLIWDLQLPRAQAGDLLAVTCTGAYNYAMASNYNRFQRPAIVFVKDGQAALVVKRESLDDLIQNDLQAEFKPLAAPLQVN
jgi:diaminopimelate decarboxylase